MENDFILVLDLGGPQAVAMARKLRALRYYTEIMSKNADLELLRRKAPRGILIAGGDDTPHPETFPRAALALGIPVLAIGVPLVVYASTIAQELMDTALKQAPIDLRMNDNLQRVLAGLNDVDGADMIVTPKEIDKVVQDLARIIADALNIALHRNLTLEETRRYMH